MSEKLNDGIYMEIFAIKDGVKYTGNVLSMKEATLILTNGLVNGIEKLWEAKSNVTNT